MKAAVFGATGFIGRHLCDTLVGRGDSVSALVRNVYSADHFRRKGINVVTGDILDEDALRQVCEDSDAVFNLAGALGKWRTPIQEFQRINVYAASLVVKTAAESGAKKVVHGSTVGVTGPLPPNILAAEDYPPKPITVYQRTKLEGEQAVLDAHRDKGMPTTIVRPAFVYGPGDMHKLPLFGTVARKKMVFVSGGLSQLHPVYVDDAVHGILLAAERAPGDGEIYNIAGVNPITTRKLLEIIAESLAVPAPKFNVPKQLLFPIASAAEFCGKIIGIEPPITRSRINIFTEHYAYSIEKAKNELGYKPLVNLPEGVRSTVEWYIDNGLIRKRVNINE